MGQSEQWKKIGHETVSTLGREIKTYLLDSSIKSGVHRVEAAADPVSDAYRFWLEPSEDTRGCNA